MPLISEMGTSHSDAWQLAANDVAQNGALFVQTILGYAAITGMLCGIQAVAALVAKA